MCDEGPRHRAVPLNRATPAALRRRILVVDDDEDIRETAGVIVRQLGFEPAFASDGRQAVATYRAALGSASPVVLVIMDLAMPGGMGGMAATREILALDPHAKVIVSSGNTGDPCLAEYRQHGFVATAPKPYTVTELQATIASVLR